MDMPMVGSVEYFEAITEAVTELAAAVNQRLRKRWWRRKKSPLRTLWREAKIVFFSSLGLAAGVWVWRLYNQFLDRRVLNESIIRGEWKDIVNRFAVDVDYRAGR